MRTAIQSSSRPTTVASGYKIIEVVIFEELFARTDEVRLQVSQVGTSCLVGFVKRGDPTSWRYTNPSFRKVEAQTFEIAVQIRPAKEVGHLTNLI